jgi:NADPH:quinone reductase-like Zn-dependent oxidoreductase
MKTYELAGFGFEHLRLVDRPMPEAGLHEILVRIRALSLNYRDLLQVKGLYNPRQKLPLVPLSDAAGEVVKGAGRFKAGDRVLNHFFPHWLDGPADDDKIAGAWGGAVDGVACEYRVFPEEALVVIPEHLSFEAAACLPCAGLTAWSAIIALGNAGPKQTVLIQGTGGVALFALQFAKYAGAKSIVTSSSDAKLGKARALGADHGINYRVEPRWGEAARRWNGGGLDLIVELGGAETLEQSLRAVRAGGTIALIGVLSGAKPALNVPLIVMRQVRLQGVTVGSKRDLMTMLAAMAERKIEPVIDRVYAFAELPEALKRMEQGAHFGKIVLAL